MRVFYGLLLMFSMTLSGCGVLFGEEGFFRNREDDYLKADSLPPLDVPAKLNSEAPGQLYEVPPLTDDDASFVEDTDHFTVPRPRPLSANALVERVKIQRLGDERWILVNVQPGQVWPQVSNFLSSNQLRVTRTDINRGLLETGWVSFKDDSEVEGAADTVHRFRVRIDKGVQPDSSEIHVLHMGLPRSEAQGATGWPEESASKDREHWLVNEMATALASEDITEAGGTSLVAQAIGGEAKSSLRMVSGEPVLRLDLGRERALATLAHASQQEGLVTFDSAPESGVIYLGYQQPDKTERGWFSRLFGLNKPEPAPTSRYELEEILAQLPEPYTAVPGSRAAEAERALPGVPGYLMVITHPEEGTVEARLRDPYGREIAPRRARQVLTAVRQNLI